MTDLSKYRFHLWTSKTQPIKYLAELLKELIPEGNMECGPEGIKLKSMSPSRNVLVHLKLFHDRFEDYKCDNSIVMGLHLENFFKIIKNMENNDMLRLFVSNDDENRIGIERFNRDENIVNTIYMSLMDIPLDTNQIAPIKFDSVIIMNSSRFQKICREISLFSDNVEIICANSQLTFRGFGTGINHEIRVKPTPSGGKPNQEGMTFEKNDNPDEVNQGVYILKYLVQFSKCYNLDSIIKIHIKNGLPLVLLSNVANLGEIKLCLAPNMDVE